MARMKINWEWVLEHVDEHGDIQEVHHEDDVLKWGVDDLEPMEGCVRVDVGLTRIEYTEDGGMEDRVYFYPNTDGKLMCDEFPNMPLRKDKQKAFNKFRERVGS